MRQFLPIVRSLALFLSVAPAAVVHAQNSWGGCFDPNGGSNVVTIGDPTRVCLQIANGTDWSAGVKYVRPSFDPEADEYSRFHIPNSYKHLVDNAGGSIFEGASITIGAASQTALSFLRLYYDSEEKRVYPFLTAIISVEDGIVTGITWDDACIFCSGIGDACQENTYNFNGVQQTQSSAGQETKGCFYTLDECNKSETTETGGTICDVTVYVVWSGTDADGKALQSQAFRFSEFPAQELSDRITQLIPGRRELKNEEAASGLDL